MARVRVQVPVEKSAIHHESASSQSSTQTNRLMTKNNLLVGGAVVIVILVGLLINDRNHLKNELKKESSSQNTQTDAQKYQEAVSKLVEVPGGVIPSVSVLTEETIKQLPKDSILQSSAKVGDAILLYKQSDSYSFVVIYRPSGDKVVLATASSSQAPAATKP